mgnify:CR=1 FL=1
MSEVQTSAAATTNADAKVAESGEVKTTQVSVEDKMYAATKAQETKVAETKATDATVADKPAEIEAKTDDTAKPAEEVAPEKYDLKVPEGSVLSDEALQKITDFATANKLSKEDAQKMVNLHCEEVSEHSKNLQDQFKQISEDWKTQASQDKEYGGDGFNRNVEMAHRVVDRFATPEFKQALNDSGFGNHPELLRVFVRIGKAMSEGSLVTASAGTKIQKTPEEIMYGSTT